MTFADWLLCFAAIDLHQPYSNYDAQGAVFIHVRWQNTERGAHNGGYGACPHAVCGIFPLTPAAEFPLHTICLLQRLTSAQLLDQPDEFQQISHAEERSLRADDELRVRRHKIRPLRGNRADGRLIDLQQKSSARPVVPLAHARQLLAAERMEGVRDAHKTRRCDGNTCILD